MSSRRAARGGRRSPGRSVTLGIALLLGIIAGCTSGATPSATPVPSFIPIGPSDIPNPHPGATSWPGDVVDAVVALGSADTQFDQVTTDLSTAVNANDMQQLLGVSENVVKFVTGNQTYIPHLQGYSATKDLGDKLAVAYAQMLAGITQVHNSLVAGDGAGVTAGFDTYASGTTAYGLVRANLGDAFNQAIFMKRTFNL